MVPEISHMPMVHGPLPVDTLIVHQPAAAVADHVVKPVVVDEVKPVVVVEESHHVANPIVADQLTIINKPVVTEELVQSAPINTITV